jgi:transcriptional/translational regulatory protein YebC/TACO1
MFQRKGQIFIDKDQTDEETLMELALEAGAEDLKTDGEQFEVITDPSDFDVVSDAVTQAGIAMAESSVTLIPDMVTEVADLEQAQSIMKFVEALEELDDVQDVYTNFDVSDEIAAQLEEE